MELSLVQFLKWEQSKRPNTQNHVLLLTRLRRAGEHRVSGQFEILSFYKTAK